MAITLKTPADIAAMRIAGRLASEVLDFLTPHVKPGVTTLQLDQLAGVDREVNAVQHFDCEIAVDVGFLDAAQIDQRRYVAPVRCATPGTDVDCAYQPLASAT